VNYSSPPLNDIQAGPAVQLATTMRDALAASGFHESNYLGSQGLYGRADLAGFELGPKPCGPRRTREHKKRRRRARQPRMLCQIDLTHSAGPEQTHDGVASENFPCSTAKADTTNYMVEPGRFLGNRFQSDVATHSWTNVQQAAAHHTT
jgi:hypothetical protein